MEALGLGLEALGKSIGICARSFAMNSFKDWFKFKNNDGRM